MVREHELFHGAALLKLISSSGTAVEIKPFAHLAGKSSYVVNGKIGIYIKHSALRMSPWSFTFQRVHQDELTQMEKACASVFLLLVCETDGIVALSGQEIKTLLDLNNAAAQWISAKRANTTVLLIPQATRASR